MILNVGLNIHFCDVCGVRVTDVDLRSGHGIRRGYDVICATCLELGHGKAWLSASGGNSASSSEPSRTSPSGRWTPAAAVPPVITSSDPAIQVIEVDIDGGDATELVPAVTEPLATIPATEAPSPPKPGDPLPSSSTMPRWQPDLSSAAVGFSALTPLAFPATTASSVASPSPESGASSEEIESVSRDPQSPGGTARASRGANGGSAANRAAAGSASRSGSRPRPTSAVTRAPVSIPVPIKMMFITVPVMVVVILGILFTRKTPNEPVTPVKSPVRTTTTTAPSQGPQVIPVIEREASSAARSRILASMRDTHQLADAAARVQDLAQVKAAIERCRKLDGEVQAFKREVLTLPIDTWTDDEAERYLESHSLPEVRSRLIDLNDLLIKLGNVGTATKAELSAPAPTPTGTVTK